MPLCSKPLSPIPEEEDTDDDFVNGWDVRSTTSGAIWHHLIGKGCGTRFGGLIVWNRVSIIITASNARHIAHAFVFLLKGCELILYKDGRYTIFSKPDPEEQAVLFEKIEHHVSS